MTIVNKIKSFFEDRKFNIGVDIPMFLIAGPTIGISLSKKDPFDHLTEYQKENLALFAQIIGKPYEEFTQSIQEDLNGIPLGRISEIEGHIRSIEEENKEIRDLFFDYRKYLKELFHEYPLISPDSFERKSKNVNLLRSPFKKFSGREYELSELGNFLHNEEKFCLILGPGGFGKTKLLLEFAKNNRDRENKWVIFFIDEIKKFRETIIYDIEGSQNILLILDETMRYKYRRELVDCVANWSDEQRQLKLVLIDRQIHQDAVKRIITVEGITKIKLILLEDKVEQNKIIKTALQDNYDFNELIVENIVKKCQGRFYFAEIMASHYIITSKIDLITALDTNIEKYIEDIHSYFPHSDPRMIKFALQTIALLKELDMDDDKDLVEIIKDDYKIIHEVLMQLIDNREYYEFELFAYSENKLNIIPDLFADYFVLKLLQNPPANNSQKLNKFIVKLSKDRPLRISLNLFGPLDQKKETILHSDSDFELIYPIIKKIWDNINAEPGKNPEYFDAIIFFTDQIVESKFSELSQINISAWEKTFNDPSVVSKNEKPQIAHKYAYGLMNATFSFGNDHQWVAMRDSLTSLETLFHDYNTNEIAEIYALGLLKVTVSYEDELYWESLENSLKSLKNLLHNHNTKGIIGIYALGLVNAIFPYGDEPHWAAIENSLESFEPLLNDFNTDEIAEKYALGLVNVKIPYRDEPHWSAIENSLKSLETLLYDYNTKEIAEIYAEGLANATIPYGEVQQWASMEKSLKSLKTLLHDHNTNEIVEKYAEGLVNATHFYRKEHQWASMEKSLKSLETLLHDHNTDEIAEKFALGLLNEIDSCGNVHHRASMEKSLKSLETLLHDHNTDEIAEIYALGLLNATIPDETGHQWMSMEKSLKSLEALLHEHNTDKIARNYAQGLVNAIAFHGNERHWVSMEKGLKSLETLLHDHNTDEIAEKFALGLLKATASHGNEHHWVSMEKGLKSLETLLHDHNTDEIAERYAQGLLNSTASYGDKHQWAAMENILNSLETLLHDHYTDEFAESYASGLLIATASYGDKHQWASMEKSLKSLETLLHDHNIDKIVEIYATGLMIANNLEGLVFMSALLRIDCYKIRHCLKLTLLNRESYIANIEEVTQKWIIDELVNKCESSESIEFLKFFRNRLNDDAELIILLDQIKKFN